MAMTKDYEEVLPRSDPDAAPVDEDFFPSAGREEPGAAPAIGIRGPVFILAPPRSYTSLVCAMLGQHPQLYGLPELHLFGAETLGEWWRFCERAGFARKDGAVRATAQLFFGAQTEETVKEARAWLRRRWHLSTGMLLELLGRQVRPRILVEKSPSITYWVARMRRAHGMFPGAGYIHLLRHPRTQAESMLRLLERKQERGVPVGQYWVDPPLGWYANHYNICTFLSSIDEGQSIRIRAEELLSEPDRVVRSIFEWLGLRTDPEAIDAVKHPERSPYACIGPKGAGFGNDRDFLENPEFHAAPIPPSNLQDPLDWRTDGRGFPSRVKKLAREFGYE